MLMRAASGACRCTAPDTSTGCAIAAESSSTARLSGRLSRRRVTAVSGQGTTLNVTSVSTASVPQLPASPRATS